MRSLLLLCALTGAGARAAVPSFGLRANRRGPLAEQGPMPLRPRPGPMSPVPYPAINGTFGAVTAMLVALSANWLIYERISGFIRHVITGGFGSLKSLACRVFRHPATVTLVTMRGIIATDDEMRMGLAHAMVAPDTVRPELLEGSAAPGSMRSGDLVNLNRFERTLTRAFATPGVRAVALLMDSPGGSPAQSSLIYCRLKALRARYPNVKLLCFVEDYAASGGYYIASAADEIVADHNSLVGSIGVISSGFGYVSALKRKGLERRVFKAGASKAGLDPYLPIRSNDLKQKRRLLLELHRNFIAAVKEGRHDRLKPEEAARLAYNSTSAFWSEPSERRLRAMVAAGDGLFDGSVYSGSVAHALGLVDSVGEMNSDLQRRYGRFVNVVPVQPEAPVDLSRFLRWLL